MALWLLIVILFIWSGILSFFLFKTIANYNRLTQGVSEKTLSELLSEFLKQNQLTERELETVKKELEKIRIDAMRFLQKIGFVRFNPFADTGGDQSFVLALLDGNDDGVVITSLYARTGVRWYIKTVKKGKGIEHELSKEEQEAIQKCKKLKA